MRERELRKRRGKKVESKGRGEERREGKEWEKGGS